MLNQAKSLSTFFFSLHPINNTAHGFFLSVLDSSFLSPLTAPLSPKPSPPPIPSSDSSLSSPSKLNGASDLNFGRLRLRVSASSAAQAVEQSPSKTSSGGSTVVEGNRSYPIYIRPGLLDQPDLLQRHVHGKRVLVVTNTTIASIYLDKVVGYVMEKLKNSTVRRNSFLA